MLLRKRHITVQTSDLPRLSLTPRLGSCAPVPSGWVGCKGHQAPLNANESRCPTPKPTFPTLFPRPPSFLTSGSIRSTAYFPQLCTFGGRGTALRCDLPREERSLTTSQRGGCSGCGVLVSLVRLPVFALVSEGQTLSLPFVPLILRTETPPTAQGRLGLGW